MSFEYLADPEHGPQWKGIPPGAPEAFSLRRGVVPAGPAHACQAEEQARVLGVATGGFERFFQRMSTPADHPTVDRPPFVPGFPRMPAAARAHDMDFLPDLAWPEAGGVSVRLPAPAHEAPLPPARPGAYGTRVLPGVPLFLRERLHV